MEAGGGLNTSLDKIMERDRKVNTRFNVVTTIVENDREKNRRRRAGRRTEKQGARPKRVATVGKAARGEVRVGSRSCQTMAVKGTMTGGGGWHMAILTKTIHNTTQAMT